MIDLASPGDLLRPFQLERSTLRGRFVRLGETVNRILTGHDYPEPISRQLGELLVLSATLAGALKFEGTFSLQIRSQGPVRLMLADCTNAGELRGYAQFEEGAVEQNADMPALFGDGHLALTVEQPEVGDSYQGIVELEGETLTDCMRTYFRQSEQIQTGLKTAVEKVEEDGEERWLAAGIMVQRLPGEPLQETDRVVSDEDWRRAMILMSSASERELVDPDLPHERLLFRLFHEEGVRVFRPLPLSFGCRCSREKVEMLLRMFSEDDIESMKLESGELVATCQFCNEVYTFDELEIARLRGSSIH